MLNNAMLNRSAVLLTTLLLVGCDGVVRPDAPRSITVNSDPLGAAVVVAGKELGTTPLEIVPADVFETGFAGMTYRYKGVLELKKAGCEPYSTEVNDALLKKDIKVQLSCDPNYVPQAPPASTPQPGSSAPPAADTAEQRLERIERLHQRGLLSDDEYRKARQRIIDTL